MTPCHFQYDQSLTRSPCSRPCLNILRLDAAKYKPIGKQSNDWKWCISPTSSPPPPSATSGTATTLTAAEEAQPRKQSELTELKSSSRVRCSADARRRAHAAQAGASSVCALRALCHRTAPSRFCTGGTYVSAHLPFPARRCTRLPAPGCVHRLSKVTPMSGHPRRMRASCKQTLAPQIAKRHLDK